MRRVLLLMFLGLAHGAYKLQEQFRWKALDYAYPTEEARRQAIMNGRFIPENNLPVGIEIWNNKLFVTVPRWMAGIPSTLNYIPLYEGVPESPPLIPYPSFEANEVANCENGFTTAYRLKADECDRLRVLDTGTFGIGNTTTNPCPYAINVFDLHTDTRIRRYELRKEDTNANTFIANIAIDIGKSCEDTFAYMSDELGYGLIAYSWEQNKSWRFAHSFFMPDPLKGDFNIGGLNFQWGEEGIFGMSLTRIQQDGYRLMHFSPLASDREFQVSTRILRDSTKVESSYHDFTPLKERGPLAHTTSRVMDDSGVQFFNLIDRNGVGCWNSDKPYSPENLAMVDRDDLALSFPADVKIDREKNVWVISDKMPNFLIDKLNYNEINFRIFFAPMEVLIKDTVCEIKPVQELNVLNPFDYQLYSKKRFYY
ncbi:protein yellow-like [Atheta coriaria]|uniref:protein yellow-like n=1 Tax=Dalotia coriaria TaxID=877792 RepID=UPI0031F3BB6C